MCAVGGVAGGRGRGWRAGGQVLGFLPLLSALPHLIEQGPALLVGRIRGQRCLCIECQRLLHQGLVFELSLVLCLLLMWAWAVEEVRTQSESVDSVPNCKGVKLQRRPNAEEKPNKAAKSRSRRSYRIKTECALAANKNFPPSGSRGSLQKMAFRPATSCLRCGG